jgi:ABC-2 type transport system permease protein
MTAFRALTRKQLGESRWLLGLSLLALFGLSWLFVYIAGRIERDMRRVSESAQGVRAMRMLRGMGGEAMDFSTAAIEMTLWNHPMIVLTICLWAVGRGSLAVGGELERGSMDLTLSRPVSRTAYMMSQVFVTLLGLVGLGVALIAGNLVGSRFNTLSNPPGMLVLIRPAANLVALGTAIYGYTLLVSALDVVRWRATLIGSVVTLASYIVHVIVNLPPLEDWKWADRFSIFRAYDPVDAVLKAEHLAFNVAILAGIGLVGIVLSLVAFLYRDLPAGGG